jgi:putative nucleotidyltransferase with HDIG domain
VTQLGFGMISQALNTVTTCKSYPDDASGRFDRAQFWRHSIAVAVLSKGIATHAGITPNDAYTCGLLHDVGKLILDQYLHVEFGKALERAISAGKTLVKAEKETTQIDHTMIGEMTAKAWHMPPVVLAAIRWHHTESGERKGLGPPEEMLVDVVRIADCLAHEIGFPASGDGAHPAWQASMLERVRVAEIVLDKLREHSAAEIERLADSIELPKRAGISG